MDKQILVRELTRIKRSMVDRIVDRIEEERHNGINFIVEEEMNKAYSEIAKIILEENE